MHKDLFDQYPHYHHLVASGMGMVTKARDSVELVLEPKPMIAGVVYQVLGIPLLTAAMVLLIKFPPEVGGGVHHHRGHAEARFPTSPRPLPSNRCPALVCCTR